MKLFVSKSRPSAVWVPIVTGLGGIVVGAFIASMITPRTGAELRGFLRELVRRRFETEESEEAQLDRMSGEGGYAHGADERAY